MKNNKPDTLTNPLLFVRAPSVGQMRDPLNANWNQALESAARNKSAPTDNLNLAELIDFSQMNAIFQNFLEVVGLPQAIIDLEGRVLASSNWQRLCMEFHRANPGTLQRCLESDRTLSREMQETLERVRPVTIGQASRIPGVTPAALSLVHVSIRLQGARRPQGSRRAAAL